MGTSTVHRSPPTPRWRIVNNLYENPDVQPDLLLAEIFNAAEDYPARLADQAILGRVEAVLDTARAGEWQSGNDAALAAARAAVRSAQTRALGAGLASFYGDLADRAVHTSIAGAARDPNTLATPPQVLGTFLSNLVAIAIEHVVSRDITAHVGGRGITNVASALGLKRQLVERARAVASDARLAEALYAAADRPQEVWPALVARVWRLGAALPAGGETGPPS